MLIIRFVQSIISPFPISGCKGTNNSAIHQIFSHLFLYTKQLVAAYAFIIKVSISVYPSGITRSLPHTVS